MTRGQIRKRNTCCCVIIVSRVLTRYGTTARSRLACEVKSISEQGGQFEDNVDIVRDKIVGNDLHLSTTEVWAVALAKGDNSKGRRK